MAGATGTERGELSLQDTSLLTDSMVHEVHAGLARTQKTLSPKYFYDKKGSELFDAITMAPEYYPARTEVQLLRTHSDELAELLGKNSYLFELGSGSSVKIRLLLEALRPRRYIPMDISRDHLLAAAARLARDYPWLEINSVHIDYSRPWDMPDFGPGRYNVFFPGSSIGNFEPHAALALLRKVAMLGGVGGGLLIGVDLKKDVSVLEAAYNDAQGVTARFNLNILSHINQRLGANFEPRNFAHRAIYNETHGRIEMHLACLRDHGVRMQGRAYEFATGETIHTENSYKYTIAEFHALAAQAALFPVKVWTDSKALFSMHYLVRR